MKTTSPTAERRIEARQGRGVLARIRRRLTEYDDPTYEEARRRILSQPGFFASLPPDAIEEMKHWEAPEKLLGPSHPQF
jgi:hypothetical protein